MVKKRNKTSLIAVLVIAVIVVLIVLFSKLKQEPVTPVKETYEITSTDIFSDEIVGSLTADRVTVFGIKLGDRLEKVYFILGEPDDRSEFPEESIINIGYGNNLGLNGTGIVFHFENYVLTLISFHPPFNEYLVGNTKINHTKREIYDILGIRDKEYELPTRPFSTRVFIYEGEGLEIYLDKIQIGFALQYPGERTLPEPGTISIKV